MATLHPTIDRQPLNVALVSAELVTTSGQAPPRTELWLTFANEGVEATHFMVKLHGVEVKTSAA
jgi:hypothetical protein